MELKADFTKGFPGGVAIQARLELPLDHSGLTVLFGPSGCGKTTVLRCLAGLEQPDSGTIQAGGKVWFRDGRTQVPASGRGIGYVFQESALFPHLTVARNIAFGLGAWPGAERTERVREMVRIMGLEGLEQRRPPQLSGGQKQRVALARALAGKPSLVLLDEPFASLDQAAAEELRHGLRGILQSLKVPAVLVTHNPVEALALGDRMIRMAGGRIVQEGSPAEILSQPGGGVGDPMGVVVRTRVVGRVEGLLRLAAEGVELLAPDPGGTFREAFACIRPEGVSLERAPQGGGTQRNHLAVSILAVEPQGSLTRIRLQGGFPFEALITTWACEDLHFAPGQTLFASIKASAIKVIPL